VLKLEPQFSTGQKAPEARQTCRFPFAELLSQIMQNFVELIRRFGRYRVRFHRQLSNDAFHTGIIIPSEGRKTGPDWRCR
jgi:hypothetical protein